MWEADPDAWFGEYHTLEEALNGLYDLASAN